MTDHDDNNNIAIDVEEGTGEAAVADTSADHHVKSRPSRRRNLVILAAAIGGTIALALGLGLGLDGGNSTNGSNAVSAGGGELGLAKDTPDGTYLEIVGDGNNGINTINNDEGTTVPIGRNPTNGGNVAEGGEEKENFDSNEFMEDADAEKSDTTDVKQQTGDEMNSSIENEPPPTPIKPRFFKTPLIDPIQTMIRLIDSTIMDGYAAGSEGCADLYQDIVNATLIVANERIKTVAESYDDRYKQKWPMPNEAVSFDGGVAMESVASVAAPATPSMVAGDSAGSGNTIQESSFGSNNQEEDVDEADVIKSDGVHVYMAYGDLLIVTDAVTGEELSRTKMPAKKALSAEDGGNGDDGSSPYPGIGPILTPVAVEEVSKVVDEKKETITAMDPDEEEVMQPKAKNGGDERRQQRRRDSLIWMPNPKPRISSLLHDPVSNRLAVIVSGYRDDYRYDYVDRPILRDQGDVHVRLYDTSDIPTDGKPLPLISSREMWGSYRSARMIDSMAHVTVQSGVDWYQHVSRYLDRWQVTYDGLNKTQYIDVAAKQAKIAADKFAKRLVQELKLLSGTDGFAAGDCSGITKVAMFASDDDDGDVDEPSLSSGGLLNSYLQVSSFDMSLDTAVQSTALEMKTAGSFFPSSWSEIYASRDFIVASGRGHSRRRFGSRRWDDSTYLLTFELKSDGSAPSGRAVGRVPGFVLNQFALDEHDGYLRVATTTNAQWGCLDEEEKAETTEGEEATLPVWRPCKWGRLTNSTSQVTILKLPQGANREMQQVAVVDKLGVTEVIMSARFFDNKAYIVTFERTDPLYTIDLSKPEEPELTDELKITGFSSYLHPVGDDRLLAIGREADETTGRDTGFKITLFDVADLRNTKVLQTYTIEERWSSSSAARDHMAFRYLIKSKLLLIPLSIYGYGDKREPFDGFSVYYVDDDKIEPRFSVSMVEDPSDINYGCWYDAYMPARTLVIKGDATFIKGHGLVSYELGTQRQRWYHNLDDGQPKDECFYYWR